MKTPATVVVLTGSVAVAFNWTSLSAVPYTMLAGAGQVITGVIYCTTATSIAELLPANSASLPGI